MGIKRAMRRRQSRRMDSAIKKRDKSTRGLSKKEILMKNNIDNYVAQIDKYEQDGYIIETSSDMHETIVRDKEGNIIETLELEQFV